MAITFGNGNKFNGTSGTLIANGNYLVCGTSTQTSAPITGMAFNSVAMTQIGSTVTHTSFARFVQFWGLANPTSGSHTCALTGGNINSNTEYSFLIGVDTSNPFTGAANSHQLTVSTPSLAITTTVNNAYAIAVCIINAWSSYGANTSIIGATDDANQSLAGSTNPVSPAGSFTININSTGVESVMIGAGFNPVPPTSFPTKLLLMGVGNA